VELDGGHHASRDEYDAQRAKDLARLGFTVVRYWNSEVLQNSEGVLGDLGKQLRAAATAAQSAATHR
jgi:very-short-patch-repair endonuclease